MVSVSFERRKEDCLGKDDKSSIGEWDKPIAKLCNKINKMNNYYTLSSCSGRSVLIRNIFKKTHDMFLFRSHNKITFAQLKTALNNSLECKDGAMFKQEPVILHVCCKTLIDAEKMLNQARGVGWKSSGIMSLQGRIVLELRSTESLALPIIENGKVIVDDFFLKILVKESNKRLLRTWEKINRLEKLI